MANHASSALPADLKDFAVFHKHRHGALARSVAHANERLKVGIHVEFDKIAARKFQPLAHFLREWARRGAEEFKHRQHPTAPREASDK
jgi:hypothetical protein